MSDRVITKRSEEVAIESLAAHEVLSEPREYFRDVPQILSRGEGRVETPGMRDPSILLFSLGYFEPEINKTKIYTTAMQRFETDCWIYRIDFVGTMASSYRSVLCEDVKIFDDRDNLLAHYDYKMSYLAFAPWLVSKGESVRFAFKLAEPRCVNVQMRCKLGPKP